MSVSVTEQYDLLRGIILRQTEKFNEMLKPQDDGLSEKAKAMLDIINEHFCGAYSEGVTKMVSALIGEVLPFHPEEEVEYPLLAFVELCENPNSHIYELNTPILVVRGNYGYISDNYDKIGNHLPSIPQDRSSLFAVVSRERVAEILTDEFLGDFAKDFDQFARKSDYRPFGIGLREVLVVEEVKEEAEEDED